MIRKWRRAHALKVSKKILHSYVKNGYTEDMHQLAELLDASMEQVSTITGPLIPYPTFANVQTNLLTAYNANPAIPIQPNANFACALIIQNALTAGSYVVTMGPVLGTEVTLPTVTVIATVTAPFTILVPKAWYVKIALTTTTLIALSSYPLVN